MGIIADIVIDRHILDGFTIAGLLLGVLGSLYLAYEFLDRKHMLLFWMTRFLASGLLGAFYYIFAFIVLFLLAPIVRYHGPLPSFEVYMVLITGLEVGLFNSFHFSALREKPQISLQSRWSVKRWAVFIVALAIFSIGSLASLLLWKNPPFFIFVVLFGLPFGAYLSVYEPSIRWWVQHLPERQLAVIGILLILFGFVLALAQPLADILDLPVH